MSVENLHDKITVTFTRSLSVTSEILLYIAASCQCKTGTMLHNCALSSNDQATKKKKKKDSLFKTNHIILHYHGGLPFYATALNSVGSYDDKTKFMGWIISRYQIAHTSTSYFEFNTVLLLLLLLWVFLMRSLQISRVENSQHLEWTFTYHHT